MKITTWVLTIGAIIAWLMVGGIIGYRIGTHTTFNDFVTDKCWLNKTTRDIECIKYIDETWVRF